MHTSGLKTLDGMIALGIGDHGFAARYGLPGCARQSDALVRKLGALGHPVVPKPWGPSPAIRNSKSLSPAACVLSVLQFAIRNSNFEIVGSVSPVHRFTGSLFISSSSAPLLLYTSAQDTSGRPALDGNCRSCVAADKLF